MPLDLDWFTTWMIPLNESKCTVLHIGKNNPKSPYYLGSTMLTILKVTKDLGIMVSDDLKWETHVSYVVKKANSKESK